MSFSISVSGINAAQKHLDVTSNNIANVNTIGFKSSRAEFADVYSSSVYTDTRTLVGNGVQTAAISQQFYQGSIDTTQNALDLAIKGDGFFVMSPENGSLERVYTRAGAFQCDPNGFVTNSQGMYLQVYDVNNDGTVKSVSLDSTHALKIPDSAGSPVATQKVSSSMTLSANTDGLDVTKFDPKDNKTFTSSTSVKIYDSLGDSHTATYYFLNVGRTEDPSTFTKDDKSGDPSYHKTADGTGWAQNYPDNTWKLFMYVDDNPVDIASVDGEPKPSEITFKSPSSIANQTQTCATLTFDSSGNIKRDPTTGEVIGLQPSMIKTVPLGDVPGGAGVLTAGRDGTQQVEFKFENINMFGGTSFSVDAISQDGSTVGQLTNVEIGDNGVVSATYSNGSNVKLGMVALATFPNQQGLTQIGDTCWRASLESGAAAPSQAGLGTAGKIQSSALEQSNTELSSQLVELITAQRNYQANSRALEVTNTVMDSILNIR
ncbi:MAG: flagellar hook protein FlgE [Succinivibrionaceae bacterium]